MVVFSFGFGLLVPPATLVTELAAGLRVAFAGGFEAALTSLEREVRVVVLAFGSGPVEPPFPFTLSIFLVVAVLLGLGRTFLF